MLPWDGVASGRVCYQLGYPVKFWRSRRIFLVQELSKITILSFKYTCSYWNQWWNRMRMGQCNHKKCDAHGNVFWQNFYAEHGLFVLLFDLVSVLLMSVKLNRVTINKIIKKNSYFVLATTDLLKNYPK